jgi:putative inorganic carbon (HCO3(-)) transporter
MTAGWLLPARRGVPAWMGAAVGAVVAVKPLLVVLAVVGGSVALIGVLFPSTLVVGMFVGMLFDRIGVTGMDVAQLPVTASKLSVLGGLGLWTVRAGLGGGTLVRWHPVIGAMLGVVAMTAISVAIADCMVVGKYDLFGLAMVTVLVGFVYTVLVEARLSPVYRVLAAILVGICLLSLAPSSTGRTTGTFGDPNEWATLVLLLTPTLLGGLAGDRHWSAWPLRMLLLLLAPLMVLRSGSRSAFVVALLVAPGCVYLLRHRLRELLASGALGLGALPFVMDLGTTWERLMSLVGNIKGSAVVHDYSLEERGELFRQGVDLFRDNWLLGSGPGTFARATGFVSEFGELRPAHNTYLEVASEQGVVGLVPFAILFAVVIWTLWRGYREALDEAWRGRVLGVSIGLASVALMAATLGLLTFSMAYLVLGLALAVVHQAGGTHA